MPHPSPPPASSSPLSSRSSLPCLIVPTASGCTEFAVKEGVHVGTRQTSADFLASVDVLLFDCDGVLWHGDKLLPGVRALLDAFAGEPGNEQAADGAERVRKKIYFLTNNSTKTRKGFLKKLEALGVRAEEDQVVCSAVVAAWYLQQRRAARAKATEPATARELVYVIGEAGLVEELQNHGFKTIGGPSASSSCRSVCAGARGGGRGAGVSAGRGRNRKSVSACVFSRDVGAVVVGLDRSFNYYKLQYAQLCINENKAFFLATNRDPLGNFTPTQVWAGAGAMVAAVEAATATKPEVAGKPSRILREYLLRHILGDLPLDRVCLVGDRLDTDIRFAERLGVRSVLTLTGVTDPALLLKNIEMRHAATQAANGAADGAAGKKKRRLTTAAPEETDESEPPYVVPDFVIASAAQLVQ
ncbi:HAD hydrolase, family IIA protein [Besnoitia besnoiti]|uniref:HAD hydrolase, family IIA protein n=1 Tax=Besnoitia besnoiti TaxID=94643 RepID=A0A2A9M1P0_BESBE|nr:HAD hydrolase, family IIA protein [Besnoitia besnoiti]PFH31905.1 HAD hydrolase, family IIA protein [Besnoitia besnoiti]